MKERKSIPLAGSILEAWHREVPPDVPFENITALGRDLAALPLDLGPHPMILVKMSQGVLKTADGADFKDLTPESFVDATHFSIPEKDVLWGRKDLTVMIGFRTPWVGRILDSHQSILAGIDDFAQIIGRKAPAVRSREREIAGALNASYGVLIDEGEGYALVATRTLKEAVWALQIMEKGAEIQCKGTVLGGIKPLSGSVSRIEQTVYHTKYSKPEKDYQAHVAEAQSQEEAAAPKKTENAPETKSVLHLPASRRERRRKARAKAAEDARRTEEMAEARQSLVDCGRTLVEEGILQGTWGNLSVRLKSGTMLVTPSGLDYMHLSPDDMVVVDTYSLEAAGERKPTSEKALHAGIYNLFPEAGAVIHTHAVNTAVYAACRMPLEIEDPELAKELGPFLPVAEYGFAGTKKLAKSVLDAMDGSRGCILANHGMICWGRDLSDAADICRKMEQAAQSAIARRLQG